MGLFAFRRLREQEAAIKAASIPPSPSKRKRKPKNKVSSDGNLNRSDSRSSERK